VRPSFARVTAGDVRRGIAKSAVAATRNCHVDRFICIVVS
jgi:hypothetical protein